MSLAASLNVGVSALRAYAEGIQNVSNNIANVNTVGYKASHAQYADTFSNILRPMVPNEKGDAAKVAPTQVGGGVQVESVAPVFSQGTIQVTNSSSDLAIAGNGFFMVRNPTTNQMFVTRAGNFRVDADGALVTQQGYHVQGSNNAFTKVIYDTTTGGYNVLGPQDNYSVTIPSGQATKSITGWTASFTGSAVLTGGNISEVSVGMPITGAGIPSGTKIAAIDTGKGQITLTKPVMQGISSSQSLTVSLQSVNAQSTMLKFPADYKRPDLVKDMPLIGAGIDPGTTIQLFSGNLKRTIPASPGSVAASVTATSLSAANYSANKLDVASIDGIGAGMVISAPGVTALNGMYVSGVTSAVSVSLSGASTTQGQAAVTLASAPATAIYAGMSISGTGVPAGATIATVTDQTHFTLSSVATQTISGGSMTAVTSPSISVVDPNAPSTVLDLSAISTATQISIAGQKTLDSKQNYVRLNRNEVAELKQGDAVSGEGIPQGAFVGVVGTASPIDGKVNVTLVDALGNAVYPIADAYTAVHLAFGDETVTLNKPPTVDSYDAVTFSLGSAYRPAATVGDVRISFNEYDGQIVDPLNPPDYTFVGTDDKPLNGIQLAAARAAAPRIRSFNVGTSGQINVILSNGQTFTSGAVLLQMFKDPGALTREGDNLFSGMLTAGPYNGKFEDSNISRLTPSTGGLGVINGGSLELSNVDLGEEFSTMITTQRAFQAGSRVITTTDQMMEEAVNLKR